MSSAGSTRGHSGSLRGRNNRRSSDNQALLDATLSVFQCQRTPSVSSSRRHRGFQPDEVNKDKERLENGNPSVTQGDNNPENLTSTDESPKASATMNKLVSATVSGSIESLAPHLRTQVKNNNSIQQPIIRSQVAKMDASRPELDPVHIGSVPKPVETETSSIQIITERKPSCWSIASPPEARPTEWNSATADIDRAATTKLPIYRIPKPDHKAKREIASSVSNLQRPHMLQESPRLTTAKQGHAQATERIASQKDGQGADSVHNQLQQLQHDRRLDVEQKSQVKAIQEEVLATTMQASPGVQLDSDKFNASSHTQGTSQGKSLSVEETKSALSALSSQAKTNQASTPPGKRSGAVPPHLRVQSARPGLHNKDKSLPPHLRSSGTLSAITTAEANAHNGDIEPRKHVTSALRDDDFPHLQGLSATHTRATKGLLSVTSPLQPPQKKDDSYQPTIDIDEEIAATQPVLDIDEEIVAGLHAENCQAVPENELTNSSAQTIEQVVYVPPHTRAPSPRLKASVAESKSEVTDKDKKRQADRDGDRNHSTNTRSSGSTVGPYAGALQNVTSKRKNAKLASSSKNGAVPHGVESSVKKGKKPAREFESVDCISELVGWDGKINPPPVGDDWDRRRPFNPQKHERLSLIEAWREEHAAEPEENNRVIVNTASPDFQTGEGLAGGDRNVLSPIDKIHHETYTSNDDFTQARRHQNAIEAMKEYEAKIAAKPKTILSGIEGMTKEEKRALRRELLEEERTRLMEPNPHAPVANIYLRPAEFKDMGQVMNIYNFHVLETSFVPHLNCVDELSWRNRLQEAQNERNPFVVAIHMGKKSCRKQEDIIRRKQENVVGFAVAANFGPKDTMYRSTVEIDLMVHPTFYHQGIGRTLLDRILAALSPDHNLLECAPFLPNNDIQHWIGGGSRQAKAIMINILYPDGQDDVVTWRKQWLAKYEFQHAGTLPHVGFKKGKLVNLCYLVLNTSVRLGF